MPILRFYHPGQPEYAAIRQSVIAHFFACHQARPNPNPEEFWALIGPGENPPGRACLGLCWGIAGRLFSEHYLPDRQFNDPEDRRTLVEIGQVASFSRGAGRLLVDAAITTLAQRNFRRAIMTATLRMREIVDMLGFPFEELGVAQRRNCRDTSLDWGTYYQNDPRVILIDLRTVTRDLAEANERRRLSRDRNSGLSPRPQHTFLTCKTNYEFPYVIAS